MRYAWLLSFLLVLVSVNAQTIADYPAFLFDGRGFVGYVIKGDERVGDEINAVNLAVNNLPRIYSPFFRVAERHGYYRVRANEQSVINNIRLASQVFFLDRPAVVIGMPCHNVWVDRVLGVSCDEFSENEGRVILTTWNGQPVIVVTGGSPERVYDASEWLHHDASRFTATDARLVKGTGQYYVEIGDREILPVGGRIGQVKEVITVGYPYRYRQNGHAYLRFPGGTVSFRVI